MNGVTKKHGTVHDKFKIKKRKNKVEIQEKDLLLIVTSLFFRYKWWVGVLKGNRAIKSHGSIQSFFFGLNIPILSLNKIFTLLHFDFVYYTNYKKKFLLNEPTQDSTK